MQSVSMPLKFNTKLCYALLSDISCYFNENLFVNVILLLLLLMHNIFRHNMAHCLMDMDISCDNDLHTFHLMNTYDNLNVFFYCI